MTRAAVLALAVSLTAAAPAAADTYEMGSDLSAQATMTVENPNDWSAWNTALPGSAQARVPTAGELNAVSIKGMALQRYSAPVSVNIQVLRPQNDGSVKIVVTSSAIELPTSGDPQQITRFDLRKINDATNRMCVERGDFIGFFLNGGAEVRPEGVQAQVFAQTSGASTAVFKAAGGEPPAFTGRDRDGLELLMRDEIGTGANARPFCGGTEGNPTGGGGNGGGSGGGGGNGGGSGGGGGGGEPAPTGPATLTVKPSGTPKVRANALSVRLGCSTAATCTGQLLLTRGRKTLAARSVSVPGKGTARVKIKLNALGRRLFKQQGSTLNVTAKATSGGRTAQRNLRIVKPGLS